MLACLALLEEYSSMKCGHCDGVMARQLSQRRGQVVRLDLVKPFTRP